MNLTQQITARLNELSADKPMAADGISFSLATAAGPLQCTLVALDTLACSFRQLSLESPRLNSASAQQLGRLGADLARRLHYLLEPIGPLEVDEEGFVLQMRSVAPKQEDAARYYYELLARRGEVILCRYRKPADGPRTVVPATVTREVFARLCEDLTASLIDL
jgi:hypothetical protein